MTGAVRRCWRGRRAPPAHTESFRVHGAEDPPGGAGRPRHGREPAEVPQARPSVGNAASAALQRPGIVAARWHPTACRASICPTRLDRLTIGTKNSGNTQTVARTAQRKSTSTTHATNTTHTATTPRHGATARRPTRPEIDAGFASQQAVVVAADAVRGQSRESGSRAVDEVHPVTSPPIPAGDLE